MPIDTLPVLDHSKPGPPEQPAGAEVEPRQSLAPGEALAPSPAPAASKYSLVNPADSFFVDADFDKLVPVAPSGPTRADRPAPDARNRESAAERQRRQRKEDAKALVLEEWALYGTSIEFLAMGQRCDVVEEPIANVAIIKLYSAMELQANGPDTYGTGLDPRAYVNNAKSRGFAAAANGACGRLTPALRARIRNLADGLMNAR